MGVMHEIGQSLRRIAITHAHPDHAGSARELAIMTGAEVYAHELDAPFLTGHKCMASEKGFWMCRAVLGAGNKMGILNPPPVDKVQSLCDGDVLGSLEVIHTPGHTPGSISLWAKEQNALFCGDNVIYSFRILRIGLPWFTLDLPEQRASLERYADLSAEMLLSGHGPVFEGGVGAVKRLI
jgi:glyoxylase-like metal-dependent hydrolase (beta-lactamase superfamily II)